jgi:hypothetical protein
MLLLVVAFAYLTFIVGCFAADQDILTILNQQSAISTFISLLEQFTDLIDTLNGGSFSGKDCSWGHSAQILTVASPRTERSSDSSLRKRQP